MPTVKEGVSNVRDMVNPDGLTVCGLSSQRKPKQCRRLGVFFNYFARDKTPFPEKPRTSRGRRQQCTQGGRDLGRSWSGVFVKWDVAHVNRVSRTAESKLQQKLLISIAAKANI